MRTAGREDAALVTDDVRRRRGRGVRSGIAGGFLLLSVILAASYAQAPSTAPQPGTATSPAQQRAGRPATRPAAAAPVLRGRGARAQGAPGMPIAEPAEPQFAANLDDSEEAAALLKRAKEATDREDWKLAIDSLQRIVDLPGDSVLRADERTYEAARRHAHRVIAALPRAGLEAYRLLCDGEAEVRYRRAIETHDAAALREIVDRLLLTRFGDRAADTLAGWWLDEGHASAAVGLLRDVLDIYPDPQVPKVLLEAKLALATALAGQPRAAEAMARAWSTATPADPALKARLESLRSELARIQPPTPVMAETWPMTMGGPARMGLMPLVEPTLLENSPWRASLSREARGPLDDMYEYQRTSHVLPVTQPVTDGRVIVVKSEGRLLAFDAETFDPLWVTSSPSQAPPQAVRQRGIVFQQPAPPGQADLAALYERTGRAQSLFLDYVGASVSLGHGLAFTIARSAESVAVLSGILIRQNNPNVYFDESQAVANQLVAFDLQTGYVRWRCGGSDANPAKAAPPQSEESAETLPGPVEFLAAPVPIGDDLLVPYRAASDLYAAVLDPADGRLKRRIYLCGLGSGMLDPLEPLNPCVADGVAYIPTGRGVFIALDTATWSIRWAVRYESAVVPAARRAGRYALRPLGRSWLPSPPIAAGGLILLAPADADFLYAFDRARGRLVWRAERGDSLYVLGADWQSAWLVGPGVTRVELETGRRAWRHDIGVPTGRGAISGNRLYLPIADYVVALDAATGDPIDKLDLPPGHPPFGNLFCWDGGFYDCDLKELRRFPDMVRSYDRAAAAHQRNPSDPSPAIRLAWLEMLRDQPTRALAALDPVRVEAAPDGSHAARLADHVAHLRVEALMTLATAPGTDAQQADAFLQQARQLARLPSDAVRAGLALAERLNRSGKPAEAYRQYTEIAVALPGESQIQAASSQKAGPAEGRAGRDVAAPGDIMIDASPGVRQPARFVIAARLAQIDKTLSDSQRGAIASWLSGMLDTAIRDAESASGGSPDADVDRVAHMADAGLLGNVGARAMLQLGIWAQRDERHEEAEYYYEDVIRRGGAPGIVAEALARLALVHLAPDELHEPVTAEREIRRLEKDYATTDIPARIFREAAADGEARADTPTGGARPDDSKATITGVQAAQLLQRLIDKGIYAQHRQSVDAFRLGPPGAVAYTTQHLGAAPLQFRGARPEPLADTMLLLSNWSEVRAHRVSDGKLLWPATLRLIDEAAPALGLAPNPAPVFVGTGMDALQRIPRPYAVNDGQVMVVNSATGLHAIGLATGLRLWSRPYRPAIGSYTASDAFLAAGRGNLLSLDADNVLTMSRMIDGEAIRWQRDLANVPSGGWAAVRMHGDFVAAVGRTLTHVSVFQAADGRHMGDVKFQQPSDKESRRVSLAVFDEVICGPAGRSEVVAHELAAPGVERWRLQCEQDGKPIAVIGLFKPQPDLLGVGCEAGVVKLINPSNGQVVLSAKTGLADSGIFEGAITEGVLCMYATLRGEDEAFTVVAVDARDGRLLWQRKPEIGEFWSQLHYAYPLDNTLLRAAANAIPVVKLTGPTPNAARAIRPMEQREPPQIKLQLTILDKRTGQSIGQPQTTVLPSSEAMPMIHQVLTWPDRVIVTGDSTYVAFRIGPPSQGASAQASMRVEVARAAEGK